jgi:hypothetical protein
MKEIFTALSKAQSQIRGAVKENTNPHFKSRYADLESVIDAIRKPLADNGLAFMQAVSDGYIQTIVMHQSGEQLVSTLPFVGQMTDMQKLSAALTYARRQGLCTAFGVPQVDDDGNAAAAPVVAPAPVAKKAPPAAKPVVEPATVPVPEDTPGDIPEPIPPGLLYDGVIPPEAEENYRKQLEAWNAHKASKKIIKSLADAGIVGEKKDLYPLFVEGRDNDEVKRIIAEKKIDPTGKLVTKHRAALKAYLSETRKETDLESAIINYFMEFR